MFSTGSSALLGGGRTLRTLIDVFYRTAELYTTGQTRFAAAGTKKANRYLECPSGMTVTYEVVKWSRAILFAYRQIPWLDHMPHSTYVGRRRRAGAKFVVSNLTNPSFRAAVVCALLDR